MTNMVKNKTNQIKRKLQSSHQVYLFHRHLVNAF